MGDRSKPSARADYRLFRTIQTRWMDNDVYGHMNNVVHYSLFDTAVNGWLVENRLIDFHGGSAVFFVVETGCRYFSELAFPDVVAAGIRVTKLGTSSVRYEIGLFRNDEDVVAAEGFFVHVFVDRATRKATVVTPELRSALEAISV